MDIPEKKRRHFSKALLDWYNPQARPMPWKGERNPYLIWLSEVMLQQTRVEQGRNYFLKFKEAYPSIADLAEAPEDELMKHWEGLGYYSRARNLHATAKHIAHERAGQFPSTYKEILALKGVGPYTAAAIASFAFGLPQAVVDGNVFRVLARFFGITTPTDSTEGKKKITQLAQDLLDASQPGTYNQAIMDFGATVCKPKGADCTSCPLAGKCWAKAHAAVSTLPLREKKTKQQNRFFHYLVIHQKGGVHIRKRTRQDIWKNLYEFPMIEAEKLHSEKMLLKQKGFHEIFLGQFYGIRKVSHSYYQKLTHRHITARFWEIDVTDDFQASQADWQWVEKEKLGEFAFPKTISLYLKSLY